MQYYDFQTITHIKTNINRRINLNSYGYRFAIDNGNSYEEPIYTTNSKEDFETYLKKNFIGFTTGKEIGKYIVSDLGDNVYKIIGQNINYVVTTPLKIEEYITRKENEINDYIAGELEKIRQEKIQTIKSKINTRYLKWKEDIDEILKEVEKLELKADNDIILGEIAQDFSKLFGEIVKKFQKPATIKGLMKNLFPNIIK